jgi:hypothetical protein
MMLVLRRPLRFAFLFVALVVAGCGQSELAKNTTYPVDGKVLIHGEPASFIMVSLQPVAGSSGAEATGVTGEDGTFQLRTYSNEDFDGAVPGQYEVTLEEYNPVEAVATPVPPGGKRTPVPKLENKILVEVKAESNTLEINIP